MVVLRWGIVVLTLASLEAYSDQPYQSVRDHSRAKLSNLYLYRNCLAPTDKLLSAIGDGSYTMLMWGQILVVLSLVAFVLMLIEYACLRSMALFYYKRGPFAVREAFKSIQTKSMICRHFSEGRDRGEFYMRQLNCSILLSYAPTLTLWFSKGRFPMQRILLTFDDGISGTEVGCETRPFYSAVLLPISICLVLIFDVVLPNQYAGNPMKIFGVIVACLIGLALYLPFRPTTSTINSVKTYLGSIQNHSEIEGRP